MNTMVMTGATSGINPGVKVLQWLDFLSRYD
jgi:hypothetical protein